MNLTLATSSLSARSRRRVAGARADHDEVQIVQVAEKRARSDQRLHVLGVADVARVHDDEALVQTISARPDVVPRLRGDAIRVDPVLDHAHAIGSRALLLQSAPHRLPDRDDPVCTPQVGLDHEPQQADQERVLEALELDCDLGEDILGDDDERDAEPPGDDEPDVTDHRRVGERQHHVGALERERAQDAVGQIRRVVDGPQMEVRTIVDRRSRAKHPHAGRAPRPRRAPTDRARVPSPR